MGKSQSLCNMVIGCTICCAACCIITIFLVMAILLAVLPYYIFYQDVFSAIVVEENNGILSVVNISANNGKCFSSFPDLNQTVYSKGSATWLYESIFGRQIGHKLALENSCGFGVVSWYTKTKSGVQCPDMKNVTPAGLPLRQMSKCDVYEIEAEGTGVKQKEIIWVEKKNPVLVDYYEYSGDTLTQHIKDYYVSFNKTTPPKSTFEPPSDILLVDLSKTPSSAPGSSPEQSASVRRESLTHIDRWQMFHRWLKLKFHREETVENHNFRLIDKFRPNYRRPIYEVINGRLVKTGQPETFTPSTRSVRSALDEIGEENIPTEYDVRKVHGAQCGTTKMILDQGNCGCCWAMAAATVFSDRACIASNGASSVLYSTQDLINCQNASNGCNGGYTQFAWDELVRYGIVTDECMPFKEQDEVCTGDVCTNTSIQPHRAFAKTAYSPFSAASWAENVKVIQADIMKYGPLEASYYVFADFTKYSGGVYKRRSTVFKGGHAVRLMGWGEDASEGPYWLVANTWGESWGENGMFRIARGTDDCGFEDSLVAGEINV